jgi:hypothetical protein
VHRTDPIGDFWAMAQMGPDATGHLSKTSDQPEIASLTRSIQVERVTETPSIGHGMAVARNPRFSTLNLDVGWDKTIFVRRRRIMLQGHRERALICSDMGAGYGYVDQIIIERCLNFSAVSAGRKADYGGIEMVPDCALGEDAGRQSDRRFDPNDLVRREICLGRQRLLALQKPR